MVNYGYVQATFQSSETLSGSANSTNDTAQSGSPGLDGNIQVRPGDRLPLVPQQTLKATADYAFSSAFSMALNVVAVGGSFARGNENNADRPDGVRYLGAGRSPGYAVVNLGARQRVDRSVTLIAQVDNLFDRRYSTGSLLGASGFDASGNFVARPLPATGAAFPLVHSTFQAPGAPRSAWVGVRYAWP
jgi:outer membrane receptor protein involved in Fe transport